MKALILDRQNLLYEYQYKVIDRDSFKQFLITTHNSWSIGSKVDINTFTLKSIKPLSDIGAYHPH